MDKAASALGAATDMTTLETYDALLQLEAGDMPLAFRMRSIEDAQSLQDLLQLLTGALGKLSEANGAEVQAMLDKLGVRYD